MVPHQGIVCSTGSVGLADGVYTVRARQSDWADNTGYSEPTTFRVDVHPPAAATWTMAANTNHNMPVLNGLAGTALRRRAAARRRPPPLRARTSSVTPMPSSSPARASRSTSSNAQLGHRNLGVTSIYLQGIDPGEIIETVHARRPPMIPASAGLALPIAR